jgi:hypothetical protein
MEKILILPEEISPMKFGSWIEFHLFDASDEDVFERDGKHYIEWGDGEYLIGIPSIRDAAEWLRERLESFVGASFRSRSYSLISVTLIHYKGRFAAIVEEDTALRLGLEFTIGIFEEYLKTKLTKVEPEEEPLEAVNQ